MLLKDFIIKVNLNGSMKFVGRIREKVKNKMGEKVKNKIREKIKLKNSFTTLVKWF